MAKEKIPKQFPAPRSMAIHVETQFEGIHNWPEAPAEVEFLRQLHRHMFMVHAEIAVDHNDRDIEFIMVKHRLDAYIKEHLDKNGVWQMGRMSCEQVAIELAHVLIEEYGDHRTIDVGVYEDGENGAYVGYN